MRCVVTFIFGPGQIVEQPVNVVQSTMGALNAREWLEDAWVRLECEPTRASGKVLLLDKVLCVTEAIGYPILSQNPERVTELATQIALALGKPVITVDLVENSVSF